MTKIKEEALIKEEIDNISEATRDVTIDDKESETKPPVDDGKIAAISLVSLFVSLLGFGLYCLILSVKAVSLYNFFLLISIIAIILPAISKKLRGNKLGNTFEIYAIIFGGLDIYFYVFLCTHWPIAVGYIGWVIAGVAHKIVK